VRYDAHRRAGAVGPVDRHQPERTGVDAAVAGMTLLLSTVLPVLAFGPHAAFLLEEPRPNHPARPPGPGQIPTGCSGPLYSSAPARGGLEPRLERPACDAGRRGRQDMAVFARSRPGMAGQREPKPFTGFTNHSEHALPGARTGGRFQRPDHPGIQAAVCDARPSKRSGRQQLAILGYRTLVTLGHAGVRGSCGRRSRSRGGLGGHFACGQRLAGPGEGGEDRAVERCGNGPGGVSQVHDQKGSDGI
jgi:hypothetical protein